MCKQLLGVQKQTTNIGVLLELGRVPMELHAVSLATKNWERIKQGKANVLLISSYNDAMNQNLQWIALIREYLGRNGLFSLFRNSYKNKPFYIHKKLFQTLSDKFHQTSFDVIENQQGKLRTYGIFKTEIGYENYLSIIKDPKKRTVITKFRLSNHRLMIEVGRHQNIPKEFRFCPFCPNKVETEAHFLLECSAYNKLRERMLDSITGRNPNFKYYPENYQIRHLLSRVEFSVTNYIVLAWELRDFLTNKHKMIG